jgi:hypothetical protein
LVRSLETTMRYVRIEDKEEVAAINTFRHQQQLQVVTARGRHLGSSALNCQPNQVKTAG